MEASARFGLPESWLDAVIAVESGGTAGARSPKGAMGLMQLMPATWSHLAQREKLGGDPFDPHANVLAGAAYLREMLDRYGDLSAALAAYNAGPSRVDAWRRHGVSLPAETLSYVARLSLRLGLAGSFAAPFAVPSTTDRAALRPVDWRASSLFGTPARGDQENAALVSDTLSQPVIPLPGTWPSALFVPVSQVGKP